MHESKVLLTSPVDTREEVAGEAPARRQVNAERRVTPERDAAAGILFDVFQ